MCCNCNANQSANQSAGVLSAVSSAGQLDVAIATRSCPTGCSPRRLECWTTRCCNCNTKLSGRVPSLLSRVLDNSMLQLQHKVVRAGPLPAVSSAGQFDVAIATQSCLGECPPRRLECWTTRCCNCNTKLSGWVFAPRRRARWTQRSVAGRRGHRALPDLRPYFVIAGRGRGLWNAKTSV